MAKGWLRGLFRDRYAPEAKSTDISATTWRALFGEEMLSKTGLSVTLDRAIRVSTVLACARVIAEGIAQLPLKLYREQSGGGKEPAKDLPLYRLMARQPNPWMTSFEFRETMTWHAVLAKGAFALKTMLDGQIRELIPVPPGYVTVHRLPNSALVYEVKDELGVVGRFPASQVLHVRGPSWDGYSGLDILQEAREAIGLAMATEENHARLFGNGARPGGILSTDKPLDDPTLKRLREGWQQQQEGLNRAFKTAVLDNGIKFQPLAMTGLDAQALESRRHQVEEVCRFMRVFPQMVGHADKTATYASAEQFFLAHVVHCLTPWMCRWEQALDRDLLPPDQDELFFKLMAQGLLRGDAKSRSDYYTAMFNISALNPNEIRELEDRNPYPGGAEFARPLNMGKPGGNPKQPATAPTDDEPEDDEPEAGEDAETEE